MRFGLDAQCPAITLYVTDSSHTLRGRWVHQIDCHGRMNTGTFVAKLQ